MNQYQINKRAARKAQIVDVCLLIAFVGAMAFFAFAGAGAGL